MPVTRIYLTNSKLELGIGGQWFYTIYQIWKPCI